LYISVELSLASLILAYLVLAIALGVIKGRKYLSSKPNQKKGKDYFMHTERTVLTLAGFSLTALTLLVSIQFRELAQLSSTIFFFSVAFSSMIISYVSSLMRLMRFFTYVSDVLLNTGLLAIACGFFAFFGNFLSWSNGSTIVFAVLLTVLFVGALYEEYFFLGVSKDWEEVKNNE